MRRFFFSAAILAIAAGGPVAANGGDREIAQQIIDKLKVQRDAGALKDFTLDLKVDQGVVLLRGSVGRPEQKANVLAAANGIDGIAEVVDEIEIRQAAKEPTTEAFSLEQALSAKAPSGLPEAVVLPAAGSGNGLVQPATATEFSEDEERDAEITAAVVATLGAAQRQGRLKGFGVDVNTRNGQVFLNGRASSDAQRELITRLVRETTGVVDVQEEITVVGGISHPAAPPTLEPLPASTDSEYTAMPAGQNRQGGTPARTAAARGQAVPVQNAPYQMGQPMPTQQANMGMPMQGGFSGGPVPMGPYSGVGAGPNYEQPYLPNYAWPGYAAYPNYAAVSYPQQYSPSAFPYIGPFYPYPQVPLGWRRVSLEWDDGWWFLDFTDR